MGAKQNAGNSNRKPTSRLAAAISKRKQRSVDTDAISADASDGNETARAIDSINESLDGSGTGSGGSESNSSDITGGSGSDRNGRIGRGITGSGRDTDTGTGTGIGSDSGDSDRSTDGTILDSQDTIRIEKKPRKKRVTIAEKAEKLAEEKNIDVETATAQIRAERKTNRKPRYVGSVDDEVEPGVTASVILIGSLLEGGTELLAMTVNKPYFQLQKQEAFELSDAVLKVLDTFPKSVRKRFDKVFAQYYPWWNLAKVVAKISYPRYMLYQAEKEFPQQEFYVEQNSQTTNNG